ncbi:unnamed protein product [Dicrocoelium dendriticum]|nr:unnamed protein product [Dicrocoelium dendriticum]
MQSLRRTDPDFQPAWASGLPGSIPFGKIDYILAVDRHNRLYKFDPIRAVWFSTVDGVRRTTRNPLQRDYQHLPRNPSCLIIFTTDFEAYVFHLCAPRLPSTSRESCDRPLRDDRDSKRILLRFVEHLVSRVSHVRRGCGIDLAIEYLNSEEVFPLRKDPSLKATNPPNSSRNRSINPFNLSCLVDPYKQNPTLNPYRPVIRHPIHPSTWLQQEWFECQLGMDHKACVRLDNTGFSYCRTYPLRLLSVPFQQSLFRIRSYFEGHRFPVLSYAHFIQPVNNALEPTASVCFLRSGALCDNIDLRDLIDCGYKENNTLFPISPTNPMSSKRVIRIEMRESSLDIAEEAVTSLPTVSYLNLSKCQTVPEAPSNTSPFTASSSIAPTRLRRSFQDLYEPASSTLCSESGSLDSVSLWPTPTLECFQKAWLRLGNLARLPQLHFPSVDKSASTLSFSNGDVAHFSRTASADTLNACGREIPIEVESSCWNRETDFPMEPFFDPPESFLSHRRVSKNHSKFRHSFALLRDSTDKYTDSLASLPSATQTPGIRLQRGLISLASETAPHRSSWQTFLNKSHWLSLVTICLKQATHLAEWIRQLVIDPAASRCSDTYIILTGPGSGRIWQPIITSLVQIILRPATRTLSGFEDLIECEWVRLGYPFAPDPSDWCDRSVADEYDGGASFGLFIDCVHQLMYQFPVDFAFTEDYLVLLLNTALSRGGGLPPFAIEFSCSCEAARCVSMKAKLLPEVQEQSDMLFKGEVLRCFRDWPDVLTLNGLRLIANWCYWWHYATEGSASQSVELFPITCPPAYPRCWIYGWFRWIRALRHSGGGGYAFDAAWFRDLLDPSSKRTTPSSLRPKTSCSPYTGWMSDEAILNAESLNDTATLDLMNSAFIKRFINVLIQWERSLG